MDSNALPSSDFVDRVSRGGLAHPTNALYGFGRSCLHVFDAVVQKDNSQDHCRRRFEKMFGILGDSYPCDFGSKLKPVCRRLTNIFYKGLIKKAENEACLLSASNERKLLKF